jgi:hypothetical protein
MSKSDLRQFDYKKVAKLDADMWRSYYNHQFLKMFLQLLQLMRTQLHMNWFLTIRLAHYSGRAAAQYRLKRGHEDYEKLLKILIKFYKIISAHSIEPIDYKEAARFELEWWDIHRYPAKYEKGLEQSLAEGMGSIYNVGPDKMKEYAHYRAVAMMIPNHQGDNQPVPPDWAKIEKLLTKAWKSAYQAVQK